MEPKETDYRRWHPGWDAHWERPLGQTEGSMTRDQLIMYVSIDPLILTDIDNVLKVAETVLITGTLYYLLRFFGNQSCSKSQVHYKQTNK